MLGSGTLTQLTTAATVITKWPFENGDPVR